VTRYVWYSVALVFAERKIKLCSHLAPLLAADDPPEVLALWELELLAGGA
jgi:hypothetical protein